LLLLLWIAKADERILASVPAAAELGGVFAGVAPDFVVGVFDLGVETIAEGVVEAFVASDRAFVAEIHFVFGNFPVYENCFVFDSDDCFEKVSFLSFEVVLVALSASEPLSHQKLYSSIRRSCPLFSFTKY
jgi:hypothetical protein